MPAWEFCHQVTDSTVEIPLEIVEYSTHTRGTIATNTDSVTRTVATLFVRRRRVLSPSKLGCLTGLSNVAVIPDPFRTPRHARAR